MDSAGKKAGKGPLVQEEVSATLGVSQDQYLFQPVVYENHSQDSRYRDMGDINETVAAKYGTGGNNQPLVVFSKSRRAKSKDDFETWKESETSNTLNTFDTGDVRTNEIVVIHDQATRYSGKRGEKQDGKGNGLGVGEGPMFTLTEGDRHAVAYCAGNGQLHQEMSDKTGALNCMHDQKIVIIDRAAFNQGKNALYEPGISEDGISPTVVARGPNAVCYKTKGGDTEDGR